MACHTLIGVAEPDGRYTARWLHWGDQPAALVPVLRHIWAATFAADTTALAAELLAHDWVQLAPTAARRRWRGLLLRPGVGYATSADYEHGRRRGHIGSDEVDADLEWLYLFDPASDTVRVFEATRHSRWLHHSTHTLDTGNPRT